MVKGTVKVKREPPSKPEPTAMKIKKEPVAVKAPKRYVYLVFETFDRVGMYHGDSEHTAKVCAVYENEADARTHADALGGEEEDDDDNQMRYGGDEKQDSRPCAGARRSARPEGGSAILRPGGLQIRGTGHVIAARKENYRVYEHPDTTPPLSSPRSPCTQTFAPPNAAGGGGPGGANDAAFGGGGGGIATSFGPSFEQRAHLHM